MNIADSIYQSRKLEGHFSEDLVNNEVNSYQIRVLSFRYKFSAHVLWIETTQGVLRGSDRVRNDYH